MNLTGQKVYEKHQPRQRESVSDAAYLAWLRKRRSAYSGTWTCIVAAHYRTSANSGIGMKPLFQAIPLTEKEHQEQHRVGTFKFAARGWWQYQVAVHQQKFIADGGKIPDRYLVEEKDENA